MKLPDFHDFAPFVALRQGLGARKQGQFELFNPERHLTGSERSELDQQGLQLPLKRLKRWADYTWGYKNTRLVVYLPQATDYHLAQCSVTEQWQATQPVWVTTRRNGPLPSANSTPDTQRQVCAQCLQLLGYKGFDLQRNRKLAYSRQLLKTFSRDDFFKVYRLYPVQNLGQR